ncbi:hypothetical protein ACWX0K_15150 [Nitrobacteraceae bacterium UC4446_H13]
MAKPLIDIMASNSAAGSLAAKHAVEEALASLEGDAVERVARIIDPTFDVGIDESPARKTALRKARAILATGLVPDKAAVRADEREKCAKVADEFVTGEVTFDDFCDGMSAGAKTVAAAIRSGGGE